MRLFALNAANDIRAALRQGVLRRNLGPILQFRYLQFYGTYRGYQEKGPLTWKLTPLALLVILGYSLCKRFTALSHGVLGLALAGAPLGAWIAVNGRLDPPAWWLALGVLAWTAGFDILYALQDLAFDRERGLHSVPSRLGVPAALWISRAAHLVALLAWAGFNLGMEAHLFPWLAWAVVAGILAREQWVVRGGRLERIDHAFFTLNSRVGLIFFMGYLTEWVVARLAP